MATFATTVDRSDVSYDGDYAAWVDTQVGLLRAGRTDEIDAVNVAEELGDLGASFHRALRSALTQVLVHMAKWDHQSERRSRSWTVSIAIHRDHAEGELARSPSLSSRLDTFIDEAWRDARRYASAQTNLPLRTFPAACPYSWDEIMQRPFVWPGDEE